MIIQHIQTGPKEHLEAQHTLLEACVLQWHCVLVNSSEKTAYYQKHLNSEDITVPVSVPAHGKSLEDVGTPAVQHTKMPPTIKQTHGTF